MKKYRVKTGDTLWEIAQKFNTTIEDIMDCNPNIKNPCEIVTEINIPQTD